MQKRDEAPHQRPRADSAVTYAVNRRGGPRVFTGKSARLKTALLWPCSVSTCFAVARSQTTTLPSSPPDAIRVVRRGCCGVASRSLRFKLPLRFALLDGGGGGTAALPPPPTSERAIRQVTGPECPPRSVPAFTPSDLPKSRNSLLDSSSTAGPSPPALALPPRLTPPPYTPAVPPPFVHGDPPRRSEGSTTAAVEARGWIFALSPERVASPRASAAAAAAAASDDAREGVDEDEDLLSRVDRGMAAFVGRRSLFDAPPCGCTPTMDDEPSADCDDCCWACCDAYADTAACIDTFGSSFFSGRVAPVNGDVSWYASHRSIALRSYVWPARERER